MVFVNSKKFACESCIKGHRSSSCSHVDRPLFEIKKKGRPVSQCPTCRELRQSKKLHSKCTCNHKPAASEAVQPVAASSSSKTRRFIPIVPALPNGLRDALSQSTMSLPPDDRQRVDTLLNPCHCKNLWKCKCRTAATAATKKSGLSVPELPASGSRMGGLSALASAAAAMQCCSSPSASPSTSIVASSNKPTRPRSPASQSVSSNKRQRRLENMSSTSSTFTHASSPTIDLPPLLSNAPHMPATVPDFGFMPPMSQMSSLAGSGCTCGVQCACPGCVEHRGDDNADHDRRTCADGCGTCVDHSLGMELPQTSSAGSSSSSSSASPFATPGAGPSTAGRESFLDRFFARAAALPPPPDHRKTSVHLDTMNTTLYTNGTHQINLPKLECCGGQCTCPAGQCSCRTSCVGCGSDQDQEEIGQQSSAEMEPRLSTPIVEAPAVKSCCAGKA